LFFGVQGKSFVTAGHNLSVEFTVFGRSAHIIASGKGSIGEAVPEIRITGSFMTLNTDTAKIPSVLRSGIFLT
jgi:hypothetical protein